jgi:hypothetical protein
VGITAFSPTWVLSAFFLSLMAPQSCMLFLLGFSAQGKSEEASLLPWSVSEECLAGFPLSRRGSAQRISTTKNRQMLLMEPQDSQSQLPTQIFRMFWNVLAPRCSEDSGSGSDLFKNAALNQNFPIFPFSQFLWTRINVCH